MSVKTFVDTNILIYAHDRDAKEKYLAAKEVLDELWANRTGVMSTQVLQEFYVNVTRKLKKPLSKKVSRTIVNTYVGKPNPKWTRLMLFPNGGVETEPMPLSVTSVAILSPQHRIGKRNECAAD